MLNSPTRVVLTKRNIELKPYQFISFNNNIRRDQYYQSIGRMKDRLEKSTPKIERTKTNRIYQRKLTHDRNGFKGSNSQYKQDEHGLTKIVSLPSISQPSSAHQNKELSRNQIPRLSAITEENSRISFVEKPAPILERLSTINPSRISLNHSTPISARSSTSRSTSSNEHYNRLFKHSFQQIIAKTSDDRPYLQQQAHLIDQQKRLTAQKLKEYVSSH